MSSSHNININDNATRLNERKQSMNIDYPYCTIDERDKKSPNQTDDDNIDISRMPVAAVCPTTAISAATDNDNLVYSSNSRPPHHPKTPLPVANYVTTIHEYQPIQNYCLSNVVPVVEVIEDDTDFDQNHNGSNNAPPCVQSYVTPENEQANKSCRVPVVAAGRAANTITGEELLYRLKRHRKKATMKNGLIGCVFGMVLLGPLGALGVGFGSACFTKHRLKRREKALRHQLEGRLDQPLPILSQNCRR